ncbi:MAG: DNA repair protein RadC [Rickettsiales bacterium]|jgi:DNA repair protein RadC|nr:DNA repair protein RadC [Rickettsiales bacterium]
MRNDDEWRRGHRMRLRAKFLDGKITDYELFEMLLGFALPRVDARPVARALIKRYGNMHMAVNAPYDELKSFPGLGPISAIFVRALRDFTLSDYKCRLADGPLFSNQRTLLNYCRTRLVGKKREEFHVLYLDGTRRLMHDETHSVGTADHVGVYPREILKTAMNLNARFIVLLHNHPDGKGAFSTPDIELTDRIKAKLAEDGIEVLDHLLLAGDAIYSAVEMHYMNQKLDSNAMRQMA